MNLNTESRLKQIASEFCLSVDELASQLQSGKLKIVPTKLYQVMLTEAACKFLKTRGTNVFLRGANYQAVDEDEALQMFKQESGIEDLSLLAVNICEV